MDYDLDSDDDEEEEMEHQKDGKDGANTQNDAALQVRAGRRVDNNCPLPVATMRKNLARDAFASKDKLFIIKRQRPSHSLAAWHLVQVDEEETDWKRAKAEGVYHVLYYVRSYADSKKKKVKECAYWPEIHEFKRDGETMGPIVPTKPSKVEHLLDTKPHRFMWYQDTIDLFSATIAGPFDFNEGNRVPAAVWQKLLNTAEDSRIYVGAVNRIVPLDKPDTMDKDI